MTLKGFGSLYASKENTLNRLDPRSKLLAVVILIVLTILSRSFYFPLFLTTLALGLLIIVAKTSPPMLLVRLTPPIGVVGIIFIIQIFFYGKTPLFEFTLAGIHLIGYKEGLSQAVLIGSKILASVSLVLFLTMTTSMPKLIFTASWFRIPHTFVEITMFTYRYIFLFLRSAFIIRDAQMVRLGYANFKAALKSWANLAGSMIIKAYNQTLSTYEAMTCRGYTGKITLKEEIKFNLKETLVIFSIVVILIFMYLFCQDMAILR